MHAENPTHDVLVDVGCEGQSDLLRNSRTAPGRIPPLHFNDGGDEFLAGSFRTGLTSALWGKQQPVLSLDEDVMEMQQSRRLQNNGRAYNAGLSFAKTREKLLRCNSRLIVVFVFGPAPSFFFRLQCLNLATRPSPAPEILENETTSRS